MAFDYFSSGTGSQNFPQPQTYFSSGTATKPAPFVGVPARQRRSIAPVRPSIPRRTPAPPIQRNYFQQTQSTPVRSGKSVGSNSSGRVSATAPAPPPAKPAPQPLTPDEWLAGDTVYKQQRDALATALSDYNTRAQKESTDYGITNTSNRNALVGQRDQSQQDLINDYTSRGMLGGALQNAETNFNTDWGKKLSDFDTAYQNWTGDQATAAADYKTSNATQLTKAQQDALARRAAKYGL
jgi:hypothetical protein